MTLHHRLRAAAGSGVGGGGWEILMSTQGKSNHSSGSNVFANTGLSTFRTATASSTYATNRTAVGDGVGLYNAFLIRQASQKLL